MMASVKDFLSTIGINTHVDAVASPYGKLGTVEKDLAYIGVTTIRDHAWDTDLPAYRTLAAAGIKFDLIVDDTPKVAVPAMQSIAADIVSFEGSNEIDISPVTVAGVHGKVAAAVAEQQALYTTVKSNAALRAIPVLNSSIGDPDNYAAYAGTSAYSDVANLHAYAAWGDAPRFVLPDRVQSESKTGKPTVITETGYFTMLNNTIDPSGVTESVQARFTLDTLFDDFALGVQKTYLYELLDEGADPAGTDAELHYGLFHADGTPKLVATAIHNLDAILATPGVTNPAVALTPTMIGLPDTGRSLTLTGSDGSAFLAVWAEPQIWNTDAQKEMPAAASPVTVALGKTVASVQVFDPTIGSKPIASYTDVSSVVISITDHPLIIEASGSAPASSNPLAADAAIAPPGSTILDSTLTPLLKGSASSTSFFVHGSASPDTIVNLHKGDTITLWGFAGDANHLTWQSHQTANGYSGATLHANLGGIPTSLTLAGISLHDARAQLTATTGTAAGVSYLRLTDHG